MNPPSPQGDDSKDLKPTELRSPGLTSPSYTALAIEAVPEEGSCKENPTGILFLQQDLSPDGPQGVVGMFQT